MSYNEDLANRTRELIALTHKKVEEKKMFGGLCFMVNDKMCVGVEQERLMLRLNPEIFEEVIEKEGCIPMDFTGKIMKGFVFIDIRVLDSPKELKYWIDMALEYNKIAKASKKKKVVKKKVVKKKTVKKKVVKKKSVKKKATKKKKSKK